MDTSDYIIQPRETGIKLAYQNGDTFEQKLGPIVDGVCAFGERLASLSSENPVQSMTVYTQSTVYPVKEGSCYRGYPTSLTIDATIFADGKAEVVIAPVPEFPKERKLSRSVEKFYLGKSGVYDGDLNGWLAQVEGEIRTSRIALLSQRVVLQDMEIHPFTKTLDSGTPLASQESKLAQAIFGPEHKPKNVQHKRYQLPGVRIDVANLFITHYIRTPSQERK